MIEREIMISILHNWGRWQRTARQPVQNYVVSQYDTPLQKKRDVKPIYVSEQAEQLDKLILKHLPRELRICLELSYVERRVNTVAAAILGVHRKTYEHKKNEAIAMIQGVYSVVISQSSVSFLRVQ